MKFQFRNTARWKTGTSLDMLGSSWEESQSPVLATINFKISFDRVVLNIFMGTNLAWVWGGAKKKTLLKRTSLQEKKGGENSEETILASLRKTRGE